MDGSAALEHAMLFPAPPANGVYGKQMSASLPYTIPIRWITGNVITLTPTPCYLP